MRLRDPTTNVASFLFGILMLSLLIVLGFDTFAISSLQKEMISVKKEISEMKLGQKNFDNNIVDWQIRLSRNVWNGEKALQQGRD